jgi:proline iminopeptidase
MQLGVNGVGLYFDVEGPGLVRSGNTLYDRPTVIALHGAGLDHGYLRVPLAPLADRAQLVYLDFRGQGRSGPAAIESCSLEQLADDVAEFCRKLDIRMPVLFGHSFGGFVALTVAVRHPKLAGALILADSAAHVDLAEAFGILEDRFGAGARRIAEAVLGGGDFSKERLAEFEQAIFPAYTHPSTAAAFIDLALSRGSWDLSAHFFRNQRPHYDLRMRLAEIDVPTLAVVGDHDWILPPSRSKEIADAVAGAELFVVPNAGHFSVNERPAIVGARLRQFLDRIGRIGLDPRTGTMGSALSF